MNYRVSTTFFYPANSQFWIMIIITVLLTRRMKALIYSTMFLRKYFTC
jgi:hypothetical protein